MPRAEEGASAPLLSGHVDGSVAVGGQHMAVPSSLDDAKCCRICLESTDSSDPFAAGRLIAPCQCRGTSAWVHRGCLDRWRATQEDRAFSQCTECQFSYEYVQTATDDDDKGWLFDDGPLTAKRRRAAKFHMFVARDFLGVFLVLQVCIFLIGGVVRKADCGTWSACAPGNSTNPRDCCAHGFLVNNIFPMTLMKEHTQSAYYLVGLVLFFAGVGLVGVCNKRVLPREQQCCSDTGGCNCCGGYNNYWWYYQPAPAPNSCDCCCCCCNNSGSTQHHHHGGHRNDCNGNCNGGNCNGGGGEAVGVLIILLVVVIVIFAIIGIMEGVFFISIIMQRSMQSHIHMLQKASLTEQFIVEDLCGENGCRSVADVLAQPREAPDMERGGGADLRVSIGGRPVREHKKAQAALHALKL